MKSARRQIRILHIVGGMGRGGVETWLMHVLRHADRERFQMDFLVHTARPCPYDDEVRALGGNIIPCLDPARPWSYARNFRRVLAAQGRYDIVHSHVHHYSGYVLRLARRSGVPVRIAHSHLDVTPGDAAANARRRLYLALARRWIRRHATSGLAASGKAADALFGPAWRSDSRCRLLCCGIDLEPFRSGPDRSVRLELQLPSDAFVIGHVGRFDEQKNHRFLLEITRKVVEAEPKTRLLLIGDGSLRATIERRAAEMALSKQVMFLGLRPDVPRLLQSALNVFVMPSVFEGLPLAGIEAQAAGLRCIFADSITREVDIVPQLVKRLRLSDSASAWANAVLATRKEVPPVTREDAFRAVWSSPFNIRNSAADLQRLYSTAR